MPVIAPQRRFWRSQPQVPARLFASAQIPPPFALFNFRDGASARNIGVHPSANLSWADSGGTQPAINVGGKGVANGAGGITYATSTSFNAYLGANAAFWSAVEFVHADYLNSGSSVNVIWSVGRPASVTGFFLQAHTDGSLRGYVGSGKSITTPALTAGKRYRIVFGRDSDGYGWLWLDGVLQGSTTAAVIASTGYPLSVLRDDSTARWYQGTVNMIALGSGSPALFGARLSENPWEVFERRVPGIYLPIATGVNLAGQASGSAVASGSASLAASVGLAGVGVALAGGSANASATVPISATGITVAHGSAGLTATVSISAAGLAQAAGQAGLSAAALLTGAGAAQAAGNATLAAALAAMAAGAAEASGSANLSGGAQGAISASGGAIADGAAALVVTVQLAATGAAEAGGTANLTGGAPGAVSASGGAVAGGTATLDASVLISAAGFVQAMGNGALWVSVRLSAAGQSLAGGTANLTLLGAATLARDDRYVATRARRIYEVRA